MARALALLALSLALLVARPGQPWAADRPGIADHALIIGNNQYRHLPALKTAVNDARALAAVLTTKYRFSVQLLLNADKRKILRAVNRYRVELGPDDNLLIFYAGHGWLDRQTNTGFWQPVDAEIDDDFNWIANEELTRRLNGMAARHVMVIADSCYSGTLLRGSSEVAPKGAGRRAWLKRMAQKRSRTAIVSGGLEPVEDAGRNGHSIFANALLNALGENDEVLDGQSLFQLISRPVVLEADQTPRYSDIRKAGHEGGAFLFRPRKQVPPAPTKMAALPRADKPVPAEKPAREIKPVPAPARPRGGAGFKDCQYCPEMVVLPAGQFTMGTGNRYEGPAHRVTIAQPFALGRFEVTFAQWDLCAAAGACTHSPKDQGWGHGERPVIHVSRQQAAQYTAWIAAMSGRAYRLPSEAEWEYGARAGTATARYWGDEIGNANANCWQCGSGGKQTLPVGSYPANGFALHDMLGNVHEWVGDCYAASYKGAPADGSARAGGDCGQGIARGGSWSTAYQAVTVSYRKSFSAALGSKYTGFRVARAIDPGDLAEWQRLAQSGDRVAQTHLGRLLLRRGDEAGAAPWLRKAAEQDWPAAQYELGRLLAGKPEAGNWLEKAADNEDARARVALAELLAADDPVTAYMWLELALGQKPGAAVSHAAGAAKAALAKRLSLPEVVQAQKRARARMTSAGKNQPK